MSRYRFFKTDNKIICLSTYAKKPVRGIAKCSPNDTFDIEIGKKLAQLRCDEKVADKRADRALDKYLEAENILFEAKAYYDDMKKYYLDSEDKHDKALAELLDFQKNI
jgi:hypothetical protein